MIVDWLSYTLTVEPSSNELYARDRAMSALYTSEPEQFLWLLSLERKVGIPRRPYSSAIRYGHTVQYVGLDINHTLIEMSGQACEEFRQAGYLVNLPPAAIDRATRIDIAIDIEKITPDDVVDAGYSARFRSHSRLESKRGITHYIGSPKSERYLRVYRYNEPHPRANLCRVEIVHRKRYAKILAKAIVEHGLTEAGLSALASYGLKHAKIPITGENVLQTVAIIKGNQKTLYWLISQVAPAVQKLIKDGTISDPDQFFERYFKPAAKRPSLIGT